MVLDRSHYYAAFAFIASTAMIVVTSWLAARLMMNARETWRHGLAVLAGIPLFITLELLLLGATRNLTQGGVVFMSGAVCATFVALNLLRVRGEDGRASQADSTDCQAGTVERVVFSLLLVFVGPLVVRGAFGATLFNFDDHTYHAAAPAQWLLDHRLSLAPYNYHAYYPLNAELFALWFVLPFRLDALASLAGLYWSLLALGSIYAVGRAFSLTVSRAILTAIFLAASPVLIDVTSSFSAADVAPAAAMLAAIAFSIDSPNSHEKHVSRRFNALYAGLLAGFAAGCKVSFLPLAALVLLKWAFLNPKSATPRERINLVLLFALGSAAMGSFWYLRNLWLTGNPFFPAAIAGFDGPFTRSQQFSTTLARLLTLGDPPVRRLVRGYTAWPFCLWLVSALGYPLLIGRAALAERRDARNRYLFVVLVGLVALVLFPLVPFSASFNNPTIPLDITRRFVLLPFWIGVAGFAISAPVKAAWRGAYGLLAVICATQVLITSRRGDLLVGLIFGIAAWLLSGALRVLCRLMMTRWEAILSASLVMLIAIVAFLPLKARQTDHALFADARPIARAWRAVEELPRGARIAWFGRATGQYYRLYGRAFQLIPRAVKADGTAFESVYESWRGGAFVWWGTEPWETTYDPSLPNENLIKNLLLAGVDYVLVSREEQRNWPPQQDLLRASAVPVYDDGRSTIWRLTGSASSHLN